MINAPTPQFIERDPAKITLEMIAEFERLTGKQLYPAQPEMLFINFMAYREVLLREAIQDAALLNLVRFARGEVLDEHALSFDDVKRLEAQPSGCELEFSVDAPLPVPLLIPTGTVVASSNGSVKMSTILPVVLAAGALTVKVRAISSEVGLASNGYVPGQIDTLMTSIVGSPSKFSVKNVTVTMGGSERETDDHFRDRLMQAPEGYSTAGPAGAYRYHAKSAHPDIVDVYVASSSPGKVEIYPLMRTGLPAQSVLDAVFAKCSPNDIRPLDDWVFVLAPTKVAYSIEADLVLYDTADISSTLEIVKNSVQKLVDGMASRLGAEIVPSQIIGALQCSGVKRVDLKSPLYKEVAANEWAFCTNIKLNPTGVGDA